MALAAVAACAVVLGFAVALTRFDLALPSKAAVLAACHSVIPIQSTLAMLLVLAIATLAGVALVRAVRSFLRQFGDQRRFLSAVRRLRVVEVAGEFVTVISDPAPQAFCAGLLRPRVYISTAALDSLSANELRAVVAHEAHHRRRLDPLRILLIRLLADALFFVPGLRQLAQRYRELAELAADEAAVDTAGSETLAGALLTFRERGAGTPAVVGIAPERVDHLLGEEPRWRLPWSVLGGSAIGVTALVALAASLHALVRPGTLSPAELLAGTCMVAMVVGPAVLALWALSLSWRRLRRVEA